MFAAVSVLERLSSVPVVIDDELSVNAVWVVREFHVQVCAMLVLSKLCAAVAEVSAESAELPPPGTHEVTPVPSVCRT